VSRVLWISDAGSHTGFGRVTHSIGERLVRDYGHEISVLAVNNRGDTFPGMLDPSRPTPLWLHKADLLNAADIYGFSRVVEMLGKVDPDVVVMLNDPHIALGYLFDNQYDREKYLLQYRPILYYAPVDGTNHPPRWNDVLSKVTNVVAMSRWGQSVFTNSQLVHHGVDGEQFWPVSDKRPITTSSGRVCRTKRDCKAAFSGLDPDGFLIGRVDSNSGRKDYPALIKALWPVMRRHHDVQVHLHTTSSKASHGVNLPVMFSREPEVDPSRFSLPDLHNSYIGWDQRDMNALYNAFDLFVSTSRGEGFGLTIAEAAMCGVPIVAQNVSAIPEVVGPGGILLEPKGLITVPAGQDVWLPDVEAFTDAIERLYMSRGARRELGMAGHEHVRTSFSWDAAAASFHEYIEALAAGADQPSSTGTEA
jgi:glycosyltransferase involved in cell wall biosynthesis